MFSLNGCVSPIFDVGRTETVVPVSRAWVDDKIVEYITTDISDLAMAKMMGANYVPRLAEAIQPQAGKSIVERVYKFTGGEQMSIFQSAPNPIGAENQDKNYSPLWRVVNVRWTNPAHVREIRSEEALLVALDNKHVTFEITDIVVNCPITRAGGQALRGVR